MDLLSLIQQDIRELDHVIRLKRKHEVERKPAKPKAARAALPPEPLAEEAEELEPLPLFRVICCDHAMGDFPATAKVRCPFCATWHKAGAFPRAN